ncbi:MAG: M1 family metallopeptidase [Candidatus Aenigmarchaeota archaeon]|nr:M1 family metallopeptidase [Candidatus Aenigmarchaeota archaeon]
MKQQGGRFRLGDGIRPMLYRIEFRPDLKKFAFSGKESIAIGVKKGTSRITLNSSGLKIKRFLVRQGNSTVKSRMRIDAKNELLTFSLGRMLEKGKAELEIEFDGVLNDHLCGFYRSKYKSKSQGKGAKEKYMAVTQFEAPYARMAFPCFDQPDMKATFDLTLVVDRRLQAISNMPVKRERIEGDKKLLEFQRTPVMSTYLLFAAVGEFEFLEGKHRGKDIRVVTIPGKREQGRLALELTMKFLKYFEDYTGIPYPLPKLDMIAIPDFASGAMENWGAITFRELLLLADENTSVLRKRRLAGVIAHELWHMWSGDLVTMKWWNDLWLNESFADYMAYKAVEHYFPEWKIMEEFVESETDSAFDMDSLETTHPIEVAVNSPNEIEEIFDEISYAKGGNVLRMIEGFMGEEAFRRGVSKYLSRFRYGNATASDFWNELSRFSKTNIKAVIESWIRQPGFPLVEARRAGSSLLLKQKRFSRRRHAQLWKIPLVIQTEAGLLRVLFDRRQMKVRLKPGSAWFKLNQEQRGFFRTKYSDEQLESFGADILSKRMHAIDRWGLQNDLFNLCWMGCGTIDRYLDFLKHYRNEDSYLVLLDIFANLKAIYNVFHDESALEEIWPRFRQLMKEPFERVLRALSWEPKEGEPHEDSMLRSLAIGYLGFAKDETVLRGSLEKFIRRSESGARIHPDLAGPVYAVVAENFPEKFSAMMRLYETADNLEEKMKALASLYRFTSQAKLKTALDFALSPKVRSQDLRGVFGTIGINPSFRVLFFPWVRKNWDAVGKFQKNHRLFMDFLESFIRLCAAGGKEKQVRSFLKSKNVKFERTKANAFEELSISEAFARKNREVLKKYLQT